MLPFALLLIIGSKRFENSRCGVGKALGRTISEASKKRSLNLSLK
jgi:hypothetical protein